MLKARGRFLCYDILVYFAFLHFQIDSTNGKHAQMESGGMKEEQLPEGGDGWGESPGWGAVSCLCSTFNWRCKLEQVTSTF